MQPIAVVHDVTNWPSIAYQLEETLHSARLL